MKTVPKAGVRFFARSRKGLPPSTPWMVEEIGYYEGKISYARFVCYCFDGERARAIARSLNRTAKALPRKKVAS